MTPLRTLSLCFSLATTNAWLPAITRNRALKPLKATVDIPLDTFGDVNHGHEEEEEHLAYYNNDAAQTIFPFLDQWRLHNDDGSLVGIVFNHPTYKDGETIATSPLEGSDPAVSEGIVTTVTGSQYLLGKELIVTVRDWKVTSEGCLQGILADSYLHIDLKQGQRITTSGMAEATAEQDAVITTESGHHYHLLEPFVYPLLEQWKRLEGGSIAGFVYRHKKIPDGEIITTTPLVELDESQDGMILVTTASGSMYELGEAEPAKQFDEAEATYDMEEEEEEEAVDDGIYYGEDSDDEVEEEEEDIPSFNIPFPRAPKANPLEHVFAAAVQQHHKMVDQHKDKMPKISKEPELSSAVISADTLVLENATSWTNQTVWQR